MSTRIALEIAAELDFDDGVVCLEAAAVIRAQHAEIERLQAALRASIETERSRCIAICISRITPGTGSDAILRGAAREIQEGK